MDWKVYRDYCKVDICATDKPAIAVCTMMSALAMKCTQLGFLIEWMNNPMLFDLCHRKMFFMCAKASKQ